ncbi:pannexin-2 isoform X1 [Pelobates cultripes]|uniref:Pannexin n=3 Tax=Pelobates TaxID=61615 RepID=A0AAD1RTU7_PELCU|nr:pannexin-2 isoform X1 [Pelobates cultripes]
MATALLAGEKLKELILPGPQDDRAGSLAALLVQLKLELPFDRVVTIGTVLIPILLVTLVFTKNFAEEPIYCYTPHNFTRDQALYARGYCWTELKDALPGVNASQWSSLFEHKFLPYALLAFAGIMYIPALGWEFLASTRLTSELNFLLQEIDNCYHRAAEGRAPKIEKQIQSKGPGITEREKREIIENAEKEKSPEQNLFEKYLERRGRSNFLAKLYLARHLLIIFLSIIPITYLSTYYATQKQNEFTCALGEPHHKTSNSKHLIWVNCKLPSVQLQRIIASVDIFLLSLMNLIILINLIHLFIVRKSNFIFDKLNKVGIKTKKQWQKSQFCDINILAMFCNENRDHIKSLNRLDFITNESDLMYDNVVRQLLAALAQSNYDTTPTMRDSGMQTVDPSADPADIDVNEQLVIKRPRKKMKWIPSSNPLPQPFKEQIAIMKTENSKPDKPKPMRRKTATDSLIAPLIETSSKSSTQSPQKMDTSTITIDNGDKKHARHFSLDVHPYVLSNKKTKSEALDNAPIATSESQESGFLNQEDSVIVHVSSSVKDTSKPMKDLEKENHPLSESFTDVSVSGTFLTCSHSHMSGSAVASSTLTLSQTKPEPMTVFNRNPTHPLLHISTLYEDLEDGVTSGMRDRDHSPPDPGDIITVIPPKKVILAPFEESRSMISSADY